MHNIQLGSAVITSDSQRIGKVDQVVVDPDSRVLLELILSQSWFHTGDKILAMEHVDRVDDEGHVHINMTVAEAEHLPAFIKENVVVRGSGDNIQPVYGGGYIPSTAFGLSPTVMSRHSVDSSLLVVARGCDVVDVEQKKLGAFDEIGYGDGGVVTGIVVKTGRIRHHEVQIPIEQIAGVGADYVRLTITEEEFEKLLEDAASES